MGDYETDRASVMKGVAERQYSKENARNELAAIDVALKTSKAKLAKIEKDKVALEEKAKNQAAERVALGGKIDALELDTNRAKEGAYAAAKREKELGEQISAKEEERQKSIEAAIQEGEEFAKSVMERKMSRPRNASRESISRARGRYRRRPSSRAMKECGPRPNASTRKKRSWKTGRTWPWTPGKART